MNSIIDAQITLQEEQQKEIERCRDFKYYYCNYVRIVRVDGKLVKPPFSMIDHYLMTKIIDIRTNERLQ